MASYLPFMLVMPQPDIQETSETISKEAFAEAYLRGYRSTVKFLLSKGASLDQAEETAQTAWVRGWEARGQLQLENRVLPWVNSIAYHRLCNTHRHTSRLIELPELADESTGDAPTCVDADRLLNRCSPLDRHLMVQRYFEGMDMKEIAARQGLSEIAVRVRIHRCQQNLRSSLTRKTTPQARAA
jgi:RNA polymerase sigma factor (sigma-70 family)